MGFKDLCKFNEAMLAKQVWRLVHDTNSLFYKVFKAKYFPNGSIFDAKASSGSFAWRSILHARRIISQGSKWRIGDGSQIMIYGSNWLPGDSQGRILSPPSPAFRSATVSGLIDPQSHTWNDNLVDSIFLPFEAQKIKAIPLCITNQPDCLYWPKSNDGLYTVSSGYQWLCSEENSDAVSVSNTERHRNFWKKIWKATVPGKIKQFLWKACSNALPTLENLKKRRVVNDDTCFQCSLKAESSLHALWECEVFRQVWDTDFSWINRQIMATGSFENLLEVVYEKPHQLEVFAVMAWFLWMRRNKLRVKEDVIPLNQVVLEAKRFLSLHNPGRTPKLKLPRPTTTVNWRPPNRCEYKTNFDGAMFSDTGEAGIGVVIRNRDGEVMAALSEKIPQPASVTMLELLATRRAAIFIHEVGLRNSVFEGDSETVIKALQNGDKFQTAFGHICRDTLLYVKALQSFNFSHTHRQGNCVADALVKKARYCSSLTVWMESVPPNISCLVLAGKPLS